MAAGYQARPVSRRQFVQGVAVVKGLRTMLCVRPYNDTPDPGRRGDSCCRYADTGQRVRGTAATIRSRNRRE